MTRIVLASFVLLTLLLMTASAEASRNSDDKSNQLVESAFATMQKLTSYKAHADLAVGARRARIEAEVGVGKVALTMLGFDGKRSRNVLTNQEALLSTDEGKSWQQDTEKFGLLRYNFIGGILEPGVKLSEQGDWKAVGKETIEGVETIHLRLNAQSPVDLWVAVDAALGLYVCRAHIIVEGNDGDVENTVTYFDLNKPVEIQVPK